VVVLARTTAGGDGMTLSSLDAATGSTVWSTDLGGTGYYASVAYENGTVFALNYSGTLRAFDAATGALRWQQDDQLGSYSAAPITARQNYVYGSDTDWLWAVNALTGELVWRTQATGDNGDSAPTVDATGVYSVQPCSTARVSLFGAIVWRLPSPCSGAGGTHATLDAANRRLYAREVRLDSTVLRNVVVDPATGVVLRDFQGESPVALGDGAAFTLVDEELSRVDPATGQTVWRAAGDFDDPLVGPPTVLNDVVLTWSKKGTVHGFSAGDGRRVWTATRVGDGALFREGAPAIPTSGISVGEGVVAVPTARALTVYANP
jgi:outer membrane protein assembly factor BamB